MAFPAETIGLDLQRGKTPAWLSKIAKTTDEVLFTTLEKLGMTQRVELLVVLEELLLNAREHGSGAVAIWIGLNQGHFCAVFSDTGDGIHQTVPRNPKLSDTAKKSAMAILRLSLEEGITGTGVIGRGIGLHLLSEFCRKNHGQCALFSDSAMAFQDDAVFFEKNLSQEIKGSMVVLWVKL